MLASDFGCPVKDCALAYYTSQNTKKPLSRSRELGAKLVFAALQVLKENSRELAGRKVIELVEQRVVLDEWALSTFEKSGYVRWVSMLHFFSIDLMKAGFLLKRKGVWYLTDEGEAALQLGERGLFEAAVAKYQVWRSENPKIRREKENTEDPEEVDVGEGEQRQEATLQEV